MIVWFFFSNRKFFFLWKGVNEKLPVNHLEFISVQKTCFVSLILPVKFIVSEILMQESFNWVNRLPVHYCCLLQANNKFNPNFWTNEAVAQNFAQRWEISNKILNLSARYPSNKIFIGLNKLNNFYSYYTLNILSILLIIILMPFYLILFYSPTNFLNNTNFVFNVPPLPPPPQKKIIRKTAKRQIQLALSKENLNIIISLFFKLKRIHQTVF